MSALDFLLPWDSQPQEAVEVNGASSFMRGMLGLYVPTQSRKNSFGPLGDLTISGSATFRVAQTGLGFYGGSTSDYWVLPDIYGRTHHGVGTGEVTLIAVVNSNTAGNQGSPIQTTDVASNEHYAYGNLIYSSAFATTRWINGTTSKVSITQDHVIVIRSRVGEKNFYQNGIQLGAGTGNTYSYNTNSGPIFGKSQSLGWDGQCALVCVLDRYITDDEIARIASPSRVYADLFAPRTIWVPVSAGGGTPTLAVADSSHAHTLDNVVLTSSTALVVQDMAHSHALDAPTLSTGTALTVDDSAHAHALDAVALTSQSSLAADDMAHAHALDNATLTLDGANLTASDIAHAHALDGAALTLDTFLAVDDAMHGHTLDGIVLTPSGTDADASLGGRAKSHRPRARFQDYDVPMPVEVLTSTIPQDTPPTGIKPAPTLSKLGPASKLATRPAKAKAPKVEAPAPVPAPAPAATPEPQAAPAAAPEPVATAAAPVPAVAAPVRPLMLSDILAAESMTNDEILRAMKVLARLHIGPQLRRDPPKAKLIRG